MFPKMIEDQLRPIQEEGSGMLCGMCREPEC